MYMCILYNIDGSSNMFNNKAERNADIVDTYLATSMQFKTRSLYAY